MRVRRVARTVIPALVERQEPGRLALQVAAHPHFVVVHRKMDDAAAELEQQLLGIAVALVLLDRVLDRLLGQAILQLEGGDGQAIDEQRILGIVQLPGDAEHVGGEQLFGLGVAGGRRAEKQLDRAGAVFHAVAQHVDDTALGDLALQPVKELQPLWAVFTDAEGFDSLWLRGVQEGEQLDQVDGVVPVEILRVASNVTRLVDQRADDEGFEAFFAGVSRRHRPPPSPRRRHLPVLPPTRRPCRRPARPQFPRSQCAEHRVSR